MFVEHTRMPSWWVINKTDYISRVLKADKVSITSTLDQLEADCRTAIKKSGVVYLVGSCPNFDDRFLRKANNNKDLLYNYHIIDLAALYMGKYNLTEPPRLKDIRLLLEIGRSNEAPHNALADVKEVQSLFYALYNKE